MWAIELIEPTPPEVKNSEWKPLKNGWERKTIRLPFGKVNFWGGYVKLPGSILPCLVGLFFLPVLINHETSIFCYEYWLHKGFSLDQQKTSWVQTWRIYLLVEFKHGGYLQLCATCLGCCTCVARCKVVAELSCNINRNTMAKLAFISFHQFCSWILFNLIGISTLNS